jgi:CheY-like chemotaxis protein
VEAGNADEAIAALEAQSVDVAILDYNMPGRDGLALAEELRERFPVMPIAVATANVQDEIIARARAANATFIPKPVTEDGMRGFLSGAALRLKSAGQ